MTTRKRNPVLPAVRDQLSVPLLHHAYTAAEADAELRAAEAVIRAARRVRAAAFVEPETGKRVDALCVALDRLDKLTKARSGGTCGVQGGRAMTICIHGVDLRVRCNQCVPCYPPATNLIEQAEAATKAKDAEIATLRVKVAARAAGNAQDAVTIRALRAEVEAATKRAEEEREEAMRFEEAGMKWLAERDEARASLARVTEERDAEHAALLASREAIQAYCDDDTRLRAECARLRAEAATAEARGFAAGVEATIPHAINAVYEWAKRTSLLAQSDAVNLASTVQHAIRALRPSPAPNPTAHGEPMTCSRCKVTITTAFTWLFDGRTFCPACAAASTLDGDALRAACRDRLDPAPSPVHAGEWAEIHAGPLGAGQPAPIPKEEAPRPRCSPDLAGVPCPTAESCSWYGDPVMCSAPHPPASDAATLGSRLATVESIYVLDKAGALPDAATGGRCESCGGDGMQAHPGCSGCLACDGPCPTCGGTGRSPSPTGGGK